MGSGWGGGWLVVESRALVPQTSAGGVPPRSAGFDLLAQVGCTEGLVCIDT